MSNQLVWSICIALETLLLARAMRTGLLKTFPVFYGYIACVLAKDLLSIPIYTHSPSLYAPFYYTAEFLLAAIGYGILAEIYNRSLKNYSGVARFFRILFAIAFLAVVLRVGVSSVGTGLAAFSRAVAGLERDLRQLQAVLLSCLLVLFTYYRIRVGRNVRGLVIGYSVLVASEVITLSFALHPATGFGAFMRGAEPAIYVVSLLIWLTTLRAAQAETPFDMPCRIEQDYERLAAVTRTLLLRARAQLGRVARA